MVIEVQSIRNLGFEDRRFLVDSRKKMFNDLKMFFQSSKSEEDMLNCLDDLLYAHEENPNDYNDFLIAKDGSYKVGHVTVHWKEQELVVGEVYVPDNFRNKGIATSLVSDVIHWGERNELSVKRIIGNNQNSLVARVFESCGFTYDEKSRQYVLNSNKYSQLKEKTLTI